MKFLSLTKAHKYKSNTTFKTYYSDITFSISISNLNIINHFKKQSIELKIWVDYPQRIN